MRADRGLEARLPFARLATRPCAGPRRASRSADRSARCASGVAPAPRARRRRGSPSDAGERARARASCCTIAISAPSSAASVAPRRPHSSATQRHEHDRHVGEPAPTDAAETVCRVRRGTADCMLTRNSAHAIAPPANVRHRQAAGALAGGTAPTRRSAARRAACRRNCDSAQTRKRGDAFRAAGRDVPGRGEQRTDQRQRQRAAEDQRRQLARMRRGAAARPRHARRDPRAGRGRQHLDRAVADAPRALPPTATREHGGADERAGQDRRASGARPQRSSSPSVRPLASQTVHASACE